MQVHDEWVNHIPIIISGFFSATAALFGYLNKRETKEVKKELKDVKVTGEATHALSNSAMGAQLLINVQLLQSLSVQAHRLAEVTGQKADLVAAIAFDVQVEAAKLLYQDHLKQQAVVDAKKEKC